jgi:Fic family protein
LELGREIQVTTLTDEAVTTSAIEGEHLDRAAVRSSVVRRLGLKTAGLPRADRRADALVEVLLDATTRFDDPLTIARLKQWQAALFPTGYAAMRVIAVGDWRETTEPMQVVSGPVGHERVHFEAPPAARVPLEMDRFVEWWAESRAKEDGLIRAALAHLRFVTIHPFEDGNGRVGRTVTDMALAQDERTPFRLYSWSAQVETDRDAYYGSLEATQKGDGDVTRFLVWFLESVERAIMRAEGEFEKVFARARFWDRHGAQVLTARQIKVVNRLLEAGPGGFEGGLTTRKYAHLAKTSGATAKREILDLRDKGLLVQVSGTQGRSTAYELAW